MPTRFARGITLIELMVVVAIVAIIAAIAYPSFQNGLQHSRRADAFKTLLTMQLKQEEYRISNTEYSKNVADLGNPSSSYYSFSVVAASTGAATYKLQAQAIGAQSSDSGCTLLTITKADVKSPPDCWN
ncbi:type IV pilin protein [Aeromonas media]|uniref:type IV pilin protein n=1 Tax=Aeromonas media TaxID=651 RepID=UPI003D01A939